MGNVKAELRQIRNDLKHTNKRIDDLRVELKREIMQNTQRIDETNKRIDETNIRIDKIQNQLSLARVDLKKALEEKVVRENILISFAI